MSILKHETTQGSSVKVDALVLGVAQAESGPELLAAGHLQSKYAEQLQSALADLGMTGAHGTVTRIPSLGAVQANSIVLVGLGEIDEDAIDLEKLRQAAGSAARSLTGLGSVAFGLPIHSEEQLAAVAEGAAMGTYTFTEYKSGDEKVGPDTVVLLVSKAAAKGMDAQGVLSRAAIIAKHVMLARDLVNTPPNVLSPAEFADRAAAAAKGISGVKVEVWDESRLAKEGCGGILGVGQGSSRPPCLVKVSYSPRGANSHVAIVGKGITFDTGGISLKPAMSMVTMKCDMGGAAAVLGSVLAAAEAGVKTRVTGWLAIAENMPSHTAMRPSDVITIRGGKTVEVLNTDAEGRLVMADALALASEEQPDIVLDIATLTGAQMVAFGRRVAAVMGDLDVVNEVLAGAAATGESFWPMPLPEELAAELKSPVADLKNIGSPNGGGMLLAGVFLQNFVGETPWAHLDIAGPAFNEGKPYGYVTAGGTGMGVRTLLGVVEHRAKA
ncbi:leucyl aminopeptidase [Micrococcales bacterium 31B]|nr:leucyl aminopeptidase [Micrococcales bacterium 31B]